MKQGTTIITILLSLLLAGRAYAAAPSPTSTTSQTETQQVNQLKNKIASQVSQLNLVEKRGVIGKIQAINTSANQITLLTYEGTVQYVDIDEITKYTATDGTSLGLTEMKKGMQVSVLGIYNKDSQRILARYVDGEVVPTRYYGEITAIDKTNYQLTVMTDDQKSEKVGIDTASTVYSYSSGTTLATYGFSKLVVGDRVEVIGYPDKTDAILLNADRIIDYLNAPKDPDITNSTPTPAITIAPTGKGAKSISPIK